MNSRFVDAHRLRRIGTADIMPEGRCVVYWMQKDQRANDNWALIRAIELANAHNVPVCVVFIVTNRIKSNYDRHYRFMLEGLAETANQLREMGVGFAMYSGDSDNTIVNIATKLGSIAIITDESHLALGKAKRQKTASLWPAYFEAVEANLVVPIAAASDKAIYGAYLLRPRLQKVLDQYLVEYPDIRPSIKCDLPQPDSADEQDVTTLMAHLQLQPTPALTNQAVPGPRAAEGMLVELISGNLAYYGLRGDPNNLLAQSGLSSYLHYGQISAQRVLLDIEKSPCVTTHPEEVRKFYDQILVWRELAANHSHYTANYSSFDCLPNWSRVTLELHASDVREFIYTSQNFELAETHDPLWNAAQLEMVKTGRMHNYLRMYWAKKILEWSEGPRQAIEIAVYLNDKYELDGRDPNGYAGILWAIGGLHDRPWFEREVYGMVRYMNANGAAKKFDTQAYIDRITNL